MVVVRIAGGRHIPCQSAQYPKSFHPKTVQIHDPHNPGASADLGRPHRWRRRLSRPSKNGVPSAFENMDYIQQAQSNG